MKRKLILLLLIPFVVLSCEDFLDLRPNGSYNEENRALYPSLTRGYVHKAYELLIGSSSYLSNEYSYLDAMTDDAVFSSPSASQYRFASGSWEMTQNPFSSYWTRDYQAIYYVNLFLKDRVGINTQYLVDPAQDRQLRRYLQGDAFALRAWAEFDLLRKFGGVDETGALAGIPLVTESLEIDEMTPERVVRSSYEKSVEQILADCDSALVYLPLANRDFALSEGESTFVGGGIRYKAFDAVSVKALKAMVWLLWASPAFNPDGDVTRYENAANLAAEVMKYKIEIEGPHGFSPYAEINWTDKNSPEIIWRHDTDSKLYESYLYPAGFGGSATIVPSQNLVDAFPSSNGYPVSDRRSGYRMARPYQNRDPRFYKTIFYHGSFSFRGSDESMPMYRFDISVSGADRPGLPGTGTTGYYVKKFIFDSYNPYDVPPSTQTRCIFAIRWTHMALILAEAANEAWGPEDARAGFSAREALAFIRSKAFASDPYLEECAASKELLRDLVKNEWRIETCFEGMRFYNVRRWARSVDEINVTVRGASVNAAGYVNTEKEIYTLSFPSLAMPLPYTEFRKTVSLTQNAGWESWK